MRIVFQQVSLTATKTGKCLCGKYRRRKQRFMQTLNPYNRNAQGIPKTASEIYEELKVEIANWKKESIRCAACALVSDVRLDNLEGGRRQ